MRLLGLVPYPYDKAPGQRYRMEQWAPSLAQHGIDVVFESFRCDELHELLCNSGNTARKIRLTTTALVRRLKNLRFIKEFDIVYVYNEAVLVGPALAENYISLKGVPFVFDFDDAIFLHYTYISPVNRYLRLLKFPGKTGAICRLASHVIVGNSYLASYASRYNSNVSIVPSTVDTDKYIVNHARQSSDPPIIGWTGSYSTIQYLDSLRPTLKKLAEKERFKLRVVGVSNYSIEGIDVESFPWLSASEVDDLRPIDIGIMPMPEDDWTRGKCGMKALQFMGLGIPTICSPVGVNSTIIRPNENGLLATTAGEWTTELTRLLRSSSLRERLGKAGRATIESGYSKNVHAPRVARIFESVVHQRAEQKSSSDLSRDLIVSAREVEE
jgi:glycosyltransferase involved in cell wall biosynthesis